MMTSQMSIEFARFVRDACVRLNDARAVARNDQGMLAEELQDMEEQASALLAAAGEE